MSYKAYATLASTFKDAMQGLTGLIDQYQTKKTDLNTQHYLDKLEAYTDPEALQQARVNGDIAKLKESYGRYIDHKAVRGADESRINSLQELAKGDLAGANKLMSENPNLLKTAALAKYFGERDQWGKEFGLKEKETNANVALMGTRNEAARHALETQRQEYLRKEQERKAYETVYDTALKSRDNRVKWIQIKMLY